MSTKLQTIIAVSCYLIIMTKGLTIRELSSAEDDMVATTASSATESSYRKSLAKIQETPYRVPEHLQFVPKGFIYEDADDVIHVIDPPKQFEELKKIMQHQVQHNLKPIALRAQRARPKIVRTLLKGKQKGEPIPRKPTAEFDMQIQETQHLPMEILASVRKTESYLRKYKPKLPSVKQRLKTKRIQTVVWEQQQEQQQYQQGQAQRIQGVREQPVNRRHFNKKRFKRAVKTNEYKSLKGEELLNHINNLIENASTYLKQTENNEDYPDTQLETTTLRGEVLLRATNNPAISDTLNEDVVVKILENSVKATNVIMQQLKAQTNLTTITEKCNYLKVTYPNHIKNLQNQIKCMQNFIEDINQTQKQHQQKQQGQQEPEFTQKTGRNSNGRLEVRKAKHLAHKPFLVAQVDEDYYEDSTSSPLNSSLIYADVMTTIRNMLQSHNLQSIEDAAGRITSTGSSNLEDSLTDATLVYDKSPESVNVYSLQEYLTSLETIVNNLPKFSHKSLNLQEIEGGSNSKYFFINPDGAIYGLPQPFRKGLTTTAPTTIFYQFPDLPIVRAYLRNGTLFPPSTRVLEIL